MSFNGGWEIRRELSTTGVAWEEAPWPTDDCSRQSAALTASSGASVPLNARYVPLASSEDKADCVLSLRCPLSHGSSSYKPTESLASVYDFRLVDFLVCLTVLFGFASVCCALVCGLYGGQ